MKAMATNATEATPLLRNRSSDAKKLPLRSWLRKAFDIENRILLAGFLITLSFSYTQVPLFYVFHLMECDVYYSKHPPYDGTGDRCSRDEIAAGTAMQFSLLGMSTTVCGTLNLFVAGWTAKKFGPRLALAVQTVVPALRVATQVLGVFAGGMAGMLIIQCTQLITIVGGPAGYILVVNIIAGEVVEPARRTIVFGKLQGCITLGQGIGLLVGGMVGDKFGIRRPFELAFCSFILAAIYVQLALPYVSPDSMTGNTKKPGSRSLTNFFAPIRLLAPQRIQLEGGQFVKHYGLLFLCVGIFTGVLATGYVPLLIQMYATAEFGFNQSDNGWLMSEYSFMQSFFLILIFPRLIDQGRKWFLSDRSTASRDAEPSQTDIPVSPELFDAPTGAQTAEEPVILKPAGDSPRACAFDLFFLRWSLVVDGALTTIAAFATRRWHIYLAAFLLPFGSGSAPAAKGVITEMCAPSQRADILNALTLVENLARLSTLGFFGFVFAALADVGKSYLTFLCNAAVALVGAGILLLSHFPPPNSKLIIDDDIDKPHDGETEPVPA